MSSKLYIKFTPPAAVVLPYEPETTAYMNNADVNIPDDGTVYFSATAYQITGAELWTALDAFIVAVKNSLGLTLKVDNLSTKFKFLYPRIGGTATAHRVNLITGLSDGTFSGGWTHDGSGALPNGTNGYFQTTFKYDTATFNRDNQSFAFLSKTNSDTFYTDFGAAGFGFANLTMRARYSGIINTECATSGGTTNSNADSLGLIGVNRTQSSEYKVIKNGTVLATNTVASIALPSTGGFIVDGANNNNNTIIQYSPRKRTLFYGGLGMTDGQVTDLYNAWNTLETTLNR